MKQTETASDNKSLVLKDYLETASDASRRTRFNTIIMLVASVLVGVSVLNSSDEGWISLRLNALRHTTSPYTIRKFPLLCECNEQVQNEPTLVNLCESLKKEDGPKDLFWQINEVDGLLKALATNGGSVLDIVTASGINPGKLTTKLQAERSKLCNDEYEKLGALYATMEKPAAEIKYTVRAPFFGIAFDVNDIGILGGLSLWVILILLRLSLRQQIISIRVGFKEAFASHQEKDFYQILAARQVFVFPYLKDPRQSARVSWGWIELLWRASRYYNSYHNFRKGLVKRLRESREKFLTNSNIQEASEYQAYARETEMTASTSNIVLEDEWQANRNFSLRFVPKFLSLVPFGIYLFQYRFDVESSAYGYGMSSSRTNLLLFLGAFFLVNLFILGIWCITKWNELDRLWDYYYYHIQKGHKPGEAIGNDVHSKPKVEQQKSSEQRVTAESSERPALPVSEEDRK